MLHGETYGSGLSMYPNDVNIFVVFRPIYCSFDLLSRSLNDNVVGRQQQNKKQWRIYFPFRNNKWTYRIYLQYWDTLTPCHTCSKILTWWFNYWLIWFKDFAKQWQIVLTLIRLHEMWRLVWVYTVCPGMSVPILWLITVNSVRKK